jgi:hypothetical protein
MATIAVQRDQLWSADDLGFPTGYYFAAKAGGDREAEVSKIRDGGNTTPEILFTDATTSDITLTGLYRPADHAAILRTLKGQVGRKTATLKRLDVDADKEPIGVVETFGGCVLMAVREPEFDANSTSESRFELVFSVP